MNICQIVEELERIRKLSGGCLCGHFESCEECSPDSSVHQIRTEIIKLREKITENCSKNCKEKK